MTIVHFSPPFRTDLPTCAPRRSHLRGPVSLALVGFGLLSSVAWSEPRAAGTIPVPPSLEAQILPPMPPPGPAPEPPTREALCHQLTRTELEHRLQAQALEHQLALGDLQHRLTRQAMQHQLDVPARPATDASTDTPLLAAQSVLLQAEVSHIRHTLHAALAVGQQLLAQAMQIQAQFQHLTQTLPPASSAGAE